MARNTRRNYLFCNTGLVVLAGEITTTANVDYIHVARDTIRQIGYDNTEYGIDYKGCAVQWQVLRIARPVALNRCQAQGI